MNPLRKAKLVLQVAGLLAGAENLANQEQKVQSPEQRKLLMKAFLKNYGPILTTIGGIFLSALVPAAQAAVANHKIASAAVVSLLAFLHAVRPGLFAQK